jgi:hypothetical protein
MLAPHMVPQHHLARFAFLFLALVGLTAFSGCKSHRDDGQPPERLHDWIKLDTPCLPGDYMLVTFGEDGSTVKKVEHIGSIEGQGVKGWEDMIAARPLPISGSDEEFKAGFEAKGGTSKVEVALTFGTQQAARTYVGAYFPVLDKTPKTVYGRVQRFSVSETAFADGFKTTTKKEPADFFVGRVTDETRAFFVSQVVYTNAYATEISDSWNLGLDARGTWLAKLAVGADDKHRRFAFYLSPNDSKVENWTGSVLEKRSTILAEWIPIRVVLQEVPLGGAPSISEARINTSAYIKATSTDGDFDDKNLQWHDIPYDGGPNMGWKGQTHALATTKATVETTSSSNTQVITHFSIKSDIGGMCGWDGTNKGGMGAVAPELTCKLAIPEFPKDAQWQIQIRATCSKTGGAPYPDNSGEQPCRVTITGAGVSTTLEASYNRGEVSKLLSNVPHGQYTIQLKSSGIQQGCFGGKQGTWGRCDVNQDISIEVARR